VVISNYNHGAWLAHALLAIVNQSRPPWEVLIVDDASTDHSVALIRQFQQYYPCIKLEVNQRNLGCNANTNALFGRASGDYLYAAASDDFVAPGFFETAVGALEDCPEAGLVFGHFHAVDERGEFLEEAKPSGLRGPRHLTPRAFLEEYLEVEAPTHSLCGATIYRAAELKRVGYIDRLGSWSDTFAARAIGLRRGACYVPAHFMNWRQLGTNQSMVAGRSAEKMLRIIEAATALMRSPEYRDVFPEEHVRRWSRRYQECLGLVPREAAAPRWRVTRAGGGTGP
jgi:glycosyltransferase involved in cell wall biosynthesis